MKFLRYSGENYNHCGGGALDFDGAFETLEAAISSDVHEGYWAHIVADNDPGVIIAEWENNPIAQRAAKAAGANISFKAEWILKLTKQP